MIFQKKTPDWLYAVCLVPLALVIVGVFVAATLTLPATRPLMAKEEHILQKMDDIICQYDQATCALIKDSAPEITVWEYVFPQAISGYPAMVNPHGSSPRVMFLTDSLFDNFSQLLVMYYHELQHVKDSKVAYDNNNKSFAQCLDHNEVRMRTREFAQKVDAMYVSGALVAETLGEELPSYYATHDWGNRIEQCVES